MQAISLVYVNIPLEGSVARGSVGLAVSLDDEIVDGARGQQGYIRNSNGHRFSSIHFSGVINATAGQVLKVETSQLAKAGTIKVQMVKQHQFSSKNWGMTGCLAMHFRPHPPKKPLKTSTPMPKLHWLSMVARVYLSPYLDEAHYANEGDAEEQIIIKKAGNYLLTLNAVFQEEVHAQIQGYRWK